MKRKFNEIYNNMIKRKFFSTKRFIENKNQRNYYYNYNTIDSTNYEYFIFMYF